MGGGGAEKQLSYLCSGLSCKGNEIHVVYIYDGVNTCLLKESGAIIHKISCKSNYDPILVWQLFKLVYKIKPQIIQTWIPQMDILAGFISMIFRIPFIISERNSFLAYSTSFKNILRRVIGRFSNTIICNSIAAQNYWSSGQLKHNNVRVIRNILPFDKISIFQKTTNDTDPPSDIILYVGRYTAQKNVVRVLESVIDVIKNRSNTIALFFGEGLLREQLQKMVSYNDLESHIHINNYNNDIWKHMSSASLLISASLYEGVPNILLEASAIKCPLAISNIPEHLELFNNNDVTYFNPHDKDDIVSKINLVLNFKSSSYKKASNAHKSVQKYSLDLITDEYIKEYKRIINDQLNVNLVQQ
jgi:glycosyltransferase involved in cell wall biosynthesis